MSRALRFARVAVRIPVVRIMTTVRPHIRPAIQEAILELFEATDPSSEEGRVVTIEEWEDVVHAAFLRLVPPVAQELAGVNPDGVLVKKLEGLVDKIDGEDDPDKG